MNDLLHTKSERAAYLASNGNVRIVALDFTPEDARKLMEWLREILGVKADAVEEAPAHD